MKITLESDDERVPFDISENGEFTLTYGSGKYNHFRVVNFEQQKTSGSWRDCPRNSWVLNAQSISYLTVKTKEELAAEEAIQKAKDVLVNAEHSVRAAEYALKVIKENK